MRKILKVIPLNSNQDKLIKKAVRGQRGAQEEIYNQFSPKMLSVCRYYVKDIHFAEDVMITGFFKVFKYLDSYQFKGSFEGWIRRIMVRECLTFLRRKNRLIFFEENHESVFKDSHTIDFQDVVDVAYLQKIIDELPEGYKTVFLLFAVEGYSHKEISEQLKIKENTSKSQLFKARRMLQEKLNETNKQGYESKSS
ncbi:RNA polymerase sigma factor [Galbibacter mesophilus]|uniref:RNA polymerase sigma factor n=1 Tax=Galbibacter mesophilus TaxID=379069 RepID=UPI001F5D76DE|nr:sigma-70 family RNA polymerase sigma factor [Galbibacter mesophilus]MCM5661492.1 sigma-70 family RNA polymerase sigma factor [Galbibacter mesophilus]